MELRVKERYLDKEMCINIAQMAACLIGGDILTVAKEIYAHTWMYYHVPIGWVRRHADPINIGGDGLMRRLIFGLIWRMGR